MAIVASTASATVKVTLVVRDWFLSDPVFGGNVRLKDVSSFDIGETENVQWFEPLGATKAISVASEIMGAKISCTLEFYNDNDFFQLRALRRLQRTLLLRDPWGNGWYVRFNESFSWDVKPGEGPYRTVSTGFTEVSKPVSGNA